MKNGDLNKSPLVIATEAIGYYLAALFAMDIAISNKQGLNWVLLIVGIILGLFGLMVLFSPIFDIQKKIPNVIRMYGIIILLSVCAAQLSLFVLGHGTLVTILSLIFLALFIFTIIYTSRSIFNNKGQLLTIFITFIALGLVQFFFVDRSMRWDRWDLYIILLVDLIILGLFLRKVLKRGEISSIFDENVKKL
jgi:hypothetical protein